MPASVYLQQSESYFQGTGPHRHEEKNINIGKTNPNLFPAAAICVVVNN
jgi:hypothetical protein